MSAARIRSVMHGPHRLDFIEDGDDSFVAAVPLRYVPVHYIQFRNSTPATTVVGEPLP